MQGHRSNVAKEETIILCAYVSSESTLPAWLPQYINEARADIRPK